MSAESWYEAPGWAKQPIRTIPVTSGYVDSFSDLALDVDGDGFTEVIQIGYFARLMVVRDIDGDGDLAVVSAGKSGLFLALNRR